ncbi:MAG TPA: 23S rRNA (adenine(2030)-N(6))-methyltransferase RlmJ [Steroidobacteraceae bacterium]|jgi:23S rRNA (adenine2030-N6)-methyltransferase|nr:23S rRNA (adenine(2030)-N(6))-methyltransferase RlmJ [Steroidobacteraceae bacterium]
MNYKHIYHAGNFADIAKHVALVYCLEALKRKDAGFFALDTHAGRGSYDLHSPESRKSAEADQGIQRLLEIQPADKLFAAYFAAIRARSGRRLARYHGSPAQIAGALRSQDRAVFVELMPAEARAGERYLKSSGRIRVEAGDGYAALRSLLPPPERRGLVLMDPPYESAEELKTLLAALDDAYRRWSTGTYLIWYPILSAEQRSRVHARFESLRIPKMLFADLAVRPDDAGLGLAGSGLIIVNPPYGADDYLTAAYAAIHAAVAAPRSAGSGSGYVEVARLTGERVAQ